MIGSAKARGLSLLIAAVLGASLLVTASPSAGSDRPERSVRVADPEASGGRAKPKQKPRKKLTLSAVALPSPLVSGTQVSFTGTAPKAVRKRKVVLLRRVDAGEWAKVGAGRISSSGTFAVSGVATGGGSNSWKVTAKTAKRGKKPARVFVSPTQRTVVYLWQYLQDLEPVGGAGKCTDGSYCSVGEGMVRDSSTIGGTDFAKSVVSSAFDLSYGDPTYVEYNLSYRCLQFATWYGVDDGSDTGLSVEFAATVDGVRTVLGKTSLGPAKAAFLDVTSRMRIRLDQRRTNSTHADDGGPEGWAAWADARVLCSTAGA